MPVRQTLTASRNATWAPPLAYTYAGGEAPLTGARIAMQVRPYGAAPHDALLTLAPLPFDDELTSGTAGGDDELRTLTLYPSATPAQLAAMPGGAEAGDAASFVFDIRITYADGTSEVLAGGDFILLPGVTTA